MSRYHFPASMEAGMGFSLGREPNREETTYGSTFGGGAAAAGSGSSSFYAKSGAMPGYLGHIPNPDDAEQPAQLRGAGSSLRPAFDEAPTLRGDHVLGYSGFLPADAGNQLVAQEQLGAERVGSTARNFHRPFSYAEQVQSAPRLDALPQLPVRVARADSGLGMRREVHASILAQRGRSAGEIGWRDSTFI